MACTSGVVNVFDAVVLGDTEVATNRSAGGMLEVPTVGVCADFSAAALLRADIRSGGVSGGNGRGIRQLRARCRAAASSSSSHSRGQMR